MTEYTEVQLQVLNFIRKEGIKESPLYFFRIGNSAESLIKKNLDNIEELVVLILNTTETFSSVLFDSKKGEDTYDYNYPAIYCDPGRRRGSGDIWRHIKAYTDKYSIFDVMAALYKSQDRLVGHYCNATRKRVFFVKYGMVSVHSGHREIIDRGSFDEYGLTFGQWKTIDRLTIDKEVKPKSVSRKAVST